MEKRWSARVLVFIGLLIMGLSGPLQAAEPPIKIGVVFIMSGPMGGYGKHGRQSVQMALDEINAQGGVLGRKVEALFEDDKLKADEGFGSSRSSFRKTRLISLSVPPPAGWPRPWPTWSGIIRRSWS